MIAIVLEGLVALLLVGTIYYCIVLNRKLTTLRDGQGELKKLIARLDSSTHRAEESIHALKATSDQAGKSLSQKLKSGAALREELSLLTEIANGLADRLERGSAPKVTPLRARVEPSNRPAVAARPPKKRASAHDPLPGFLNDGIDLPDEARSVLKNLAQAR